MLLAILLLVASYFKLSKSQKTSGNRETPRRIFPNSDNQWEIEYVQLKKWADPKGAAPEVEMSFNLYRTYLNKCQGCPKGDLGIFGILQCLSPQLSPPCGWILPDNPIRCTGRAKMDVIEGKLRSASKWETCQSYPRAIEGERNVPEDRKQFIKWRPIDWEEQDLRDLKPPPNQNYTECPFTSAKIEIMYGVPQFNGSTSQVKTYNARLHFDRTVLYCSSVDIPGGPQFSGQFLYGAHGGLLCPPYDPAFCSLMV
ncbi:hypothetical protein BT63DRAFT_443741, partial [Microthyrium microscopicum]